MILRARNVVPVTRPVVCNGAVVVLEGRVRAVGPWREVAARWGGRVLDLGDSALLPGLVNAHCHLDYTHMAGQLLPRRSFTEWIHGITELKAGWGYSDFAKSWLAGARQLIATGTTTVGDIEAFPDLQPDLWFATPLRVHSFLEMTGVRSRREPAALLQEALERVDRLAPAAVRGRVGLSPHAPYSTPPSLIELTAEAVRRRGGQWMIHAAESAEELDMFLHRRGPLFDWLARNERDMGDCGGVTPVGQLARLGVLDARCVVVHANYLAPADVALLARNQVTVVHCPRSHAFFGHAPFPLAALRRRRVNIALGTDSLATVVKRRGEPVQLDLFAEMAAFAEAHPGVAPDRILRMATQSGAIALGRAGVIGEISTGAMADLIALEGVPDGRKLMEAVVHHRGAVAASMVEGVWVSGCSRER
ncbi:MAG TPA: amidohydrolase family protein [Verrucomicrobiota bacterium]|nr:amidohydrolase family protein [Verrucomicrobiota bacterium]HNU52994.1 amidohydrolase family protein [Verrucomicrobiota bacterium]